MEKDFKKWHARKEKIHNEKSRSFFHEREVWWCSLKKTTRFYEAVFLEDGIPRAALLSQLRLIDAKRLLAKIGTISRENYLQIQKAVICLCSV